MPLLLVPGWRNFEKKSLAEIAARQWAVANEMILDDLKKIPRERWRGLRAREVMRTVNSSLFVPENATIESANELIEQNGIGAVAVVAGSGELVGFFRRGRLRKK